MEEQRKGPTLAAAEASRNDDRDNDTIDDMSVCRRNGLDARVPPADDIVDLTSHQLPSPHPTPPPSTQQSIASTVSSNVGTPLPTIHSDEDYSSDVSSTRTRADPDPNDASSFSSSSSSGSMPPPLSTDDPAKREINGTNTVAQGRPMRASKSQENVRRLSAAEIHQLTDSPHSLPIAVVPDALTTDHRRTGRLSPSELQAIRESILGNSASDLRSDLRDGDRDSTTATLRIPTNARTLSTPPISRNRGGSVHSSPRRNSFHPVGPYPNLHSLPTTPLVHQNPLPFHRPERRDSAPKNPALAPGTPITPVTPIPVPPVSLPTHLQLELAAQKPSPLYIQRPATIDVPYESSRIKIERLINVILLPPFLERTLTIGALACLDSWLYTFTILPLRFFIAVGILFQWWGHVFAKEVKWITGFVWYGLGRLWTRGIFRSRIRKRRGDSVDSCSSEGKPPNPSEFGAPQPANAESSSSTAGYVNRGPQTKSRPASTIFRHRRTKSRPSNLSAYNKADLLQGALIVCSSIALMKLDGSRMYHFIRAQSDIKLYVIFNLLEVTTKTLQHSLLRNVLLTFIRRWEIDC